MALRVEIASILAYLEAGDINIGLVLQGIKLKFIFKIGTVVLHKRGWLELECSVREEPAAVNYEHAEEAPIDTRLSNCHERRRFTEMANSACD